MIDLPKYINLDLIDNENHPKINHHNQDDIRRKHELRDVKRQNHHEQIIYLI